MKLPTAAWVSAGILLGTPVAALASCPAVGGVKMQGPTEAPFEVSLESPESIPLSAPFQVEVVICALKTGMPTRVIIDATMPAHKHGMNYEPSLSAIEEGRYEVKGLLFHMPGVWRFEVTAYQDGKPHRFYHEVKVK